MEGQSVYYAEINPDGSLSKFGALDPNQNEGQQGDPEWFFLGHTFCVYLWAGTDADAERYARSLWQRYRLQVEA